MVATPILKKLFDAFPNGFINHNLEFIAHPHHRVNSYFCLGNCETEEEISEIYTYLGNCVNHPKTLKFIRSGYDMSVLYEPRGGASDA